MRIPQDDDDYDDDDEKMSQGFIGITWSHKDDMSGAEQETFITTAIC